MGTTKLGYLLFLPVVLGSLLAGSSAQDQAACPSGDCLLPDVTYEICTSTPTPTSTPNPRKYIAGSNGLPQGDDPGVGARGHYNWDPYLPPRSYSDGLEHIPMIRDWKQLTLQVLSQLDITTTTTLIGGNSDWILLFNEPDLDYPAGSLMTSAQVVQGQALIEALFPDRLIVSPAYSQYAYTRLEVDYENFYQEYGRYPRWDAIAYHCYFTDTAAPCVSVLNWMIAFANRIEQDTDKRPEIWNTEFAALVPKSTNPSWSAYVAAASAYIDTMEALGVTRYFWFSHCDEAMPSFICELELDGSLTPLGEMYLLK